MLTLDHYQEILHKRDLDQYKTQKQNNIKQQALSILFNTVQTYCNFQGYCEVECEDLCQMDDPISEINLWLEQEDKNILTKQQQVDILETLYNYKINFYSN